MLPSVLYMCEIWCITPAEEHRLEMFANEV